MEDVRCLLLAKDDPKTPFQDEESTTLLPQKSINRKSGEIVRSECKSERKRSLLEEARSSRSVVRQVSI